MSAPTAVPTPALAGGSRVDAGARRPSPHGRRPHPGAPRPAAPTLLPLGAAVALLAVIEAALLLSQPDAPWQLALFPAAACTWFAAGAVAAVRRPANRIGTILLIGALVWLTAGLANAPYPALSAVGLLVAALPLAIVGHLLHAFPSGRLPGTVSRAIVGGLYVAAVLLQAPSWLFRPDGSGGPLQIADRPDLAQLGQTVQELVGGGLMLATAVVLIVRLRAATPAQRRILAPLSLYGTAAVVLVPTLSRLEGPLLGDDPVVLFTLQAVLLGLVPIAFVGAVLRGGFAPTTDARQLGARLTVAADDERRRIAHDLHDGVQGRLVLLALRAAELRRQADDADAVRGVADALSRELDATQGELRRLVRGVLPAALVESGLAAAADELADRMPLPTRVEADDDRYPHAIESAGWFAVSEALTNVVKHADARSVTVRIEGTERGLRIEVGDDGRGGATADGAGSGLRGIADRVDVLGGRIVVDSPPGRGTRIVVEVPCAS